MLLNTLQCPGHPPPPPPANTHPAQTVNTAKVENYSINLLSAIIPVPLVTSQAYPQSQRYHQGKLATHYEMIGISRPSTCQALGCKPLNSLYSLNRKLN